MFQNIQCFSFASFIDLNMGYLLIPLMEPMQKILTIVCILSMDIKQAMDIFQSRMVGIFKSMQENRPNSYMNDIFHGEGNDFSEHLAILDEILNSLKQAKMQINLEKSNLCGKTVECLVFSLAQTGH